MRIIGDIKLDFSDVLITPKRSQLISRKDADLTRKFTFKHSRREWTGVPIVASNMDHTGTIQMFNVMSEHDMLTALCKFIRSEEHTSELQSRRNLVCRLLLEKKNIKYNIKK